MWATATREIENNFVEFNLTRDEWVSTRDPTFLLPDKPAALGSCIPL